jgi:hypothetical protein
VIHQQHLRFFFVTLSFRFLACNSLQLVDLYFVNRVLALNYCSFQLFHQVILKVLLLFFNKLMFIVLNFLSKLFTFLTRPDNTDFWIETLLPQWFVSLRAAVGFIVHNV